MPDAPRIHPGYVLRETYARLVALVRLTAQDGMAEVWGVSRFAGGDDFRRRLARAMLPARALPPARAMPPGRDQPPRPPN